MANVRKGPCKNTNDVMRFHRFGSLLVGIGRGFRETNLAIVSGLSDSPGQMKESIGKNRILRISLGYLCIFVGSYLLVFSYLYFAFCFNFVTAKKRFSGLT